MNMQIQGKIHAAFPAAQVTERFRKREFVLELEGASRYPQYVQFQLTGDRCEALEEELPYSHRDVARPVADELDEWCTGLIEAAAANLTRIEALLASDASGDNGTSDESEANGMAYANALERWGAVGGYEAEVFWDTCVTKTLGITWAEIDGRPASTFSSKAFFWLVKKPKKQR